MKVEKSLRCLVGISPSLLAAYLKKEFMRLLIVSALIIALIETGLFSRIEISVYWMKVLLISFECYKNS